MCVSIIKGKQQPWEPVYVLLHYRHGQVLLGKPADRESNTQTPCEHIYEPHGKWRLTWSQRAISRVFQRDTPVVSSRFMLPRNTTRFTRWFLQLACWRQRQGENVCFQQCLHFIFLELDAWESWGSIKDNISIPRAPPPPLTWRTVPERGSMMRIFLSLQLVASRLPSVLKDMLRMTSVWQSIIFTGSPISRFQIRICQDQQGLCRWRDSKADDLVWSFVLQTLR